MIFLLERKRFPTTNQGLIFFRKFPNIYIPKRQWKLSDQIFQEFGL